MRIDSMTKRLEAIERGKNRSVILGMRWPSSEEKTAYFLTGGMKNDRPCDAEGAIIIDLQWSEKPPQGDAFKLRWLGQYTPEQIEDFRQIWEKSHSERDKAALKELERLLSMA